MSSEGVIQKSVLVQAVLQMPDILAEIFPVCSTETHDVATRVCVVWRQLTLGPVWRVVRNPLKLLNALSTLSSDHKNFITIPSPQDWKSFEAIALSVRELVCHNDWPITTTIVKDLLLATWIPKPMFSNLESFAWELSKNPGESTKNFEIFETHCLHSMFLHPGLSRLTLDDLSTRISDDCVRYPLGRFAQDVAHLAPNITHLTISLRAIPSSTKITRLVHAITSLLLRLPALRSVKLSPCCLTPEILNALSHARQLESLESYVYIDAEDWATAGDVSQDLTLYALPEMQESTFLSLNIITLCMPIEMATHMLLHVGFPTVQLTRLSVRSTSPFPPSNEILRTFFSAFTSGCPRATCLFLAVDSPIRLPADAPVIIERLDFHTLSPIMKAVQLEELVIRDSRALLDVPEDELLHIMQPLVNLNTLWLVPAPDWETPTSAPRPIYTLRTAQKLIEGHPKLIDLGLYVDLSYTFDDTQSRTARLQTLFLGTSPFYPSISHHALTVNLAEGHRVVPLREDLWVKWGFLKGFFTLPDITTVIENGWRRMRFSDMNNEYVIQDPYGEDVAS